MKIATHTDLDGLCSSALFLRKFGTDIEIEYITVNKAKELTVSGSIFDYTCDLPKIGSSINIDHHKSNYEALVEANRLTEEDNVDPNAGSATSLVYSMFKLENDPISSEICEIGHSADTAQLTNQFYPLVIVTSMNLDNPENLRKISELLSRLGKKILKSQWLIENYEKVESVCVETKEVIKRFVSQRNSFPRILIMDTRPSIPNKLAKEVFPPLFKKNVAVIAAIYMSAPSGELRVSFRVNRLEQRHYDVSRVASAFGGGGHIMAAGCSPKPEEIPEKLVQELRNIAKPKDSIEFVKL
ncbi:MAG: DHHA1 domain-containing protein [Candidatus Hodarchaeales archaeon]|jgi:phosphoesterase RecJ-like protein